MGGECWRLSLAMAQGCHTGYLLVNTATTVHIVGRLNVRSALVRRLEAVLHAYIRTSIDLLARGAEIGAASNHVVCKLHVLVDSVIDSLDAIGVIDSKFWIPWRLDGFADNTVYDT